MFWLWTLGVRLIWRKICFELKVVFKWLCEISYFLLSYVEMFWARVKIKKVGNKWLKCFERNQCNWDRKRFWKRRFPTKTWKSYWVDLLHWHDRAPQRHGHAWLFCQTLDFCLKVNHGHASGGHNCVWLSSVWKLIFLTLKCSQGARLVCKPLNLICKSLIMMYEHY